MSTAIVTKSTQPPKTERKHPLSESDDLNGPLQKMARVSGPPEVAYDINGKSTLYSNIMIELTRHALFV